MAILGEYALTLNDLKKRQNPDGTIADIIDIIQRSDPIMEHIRWAQGNLPTGNQTTQRTGVPRAELRRINRGVGNVKSTTRQVVDTCAMLEAHSQIDVELLGLQPNPQAFRASEDAAIVEGMTQQVADMIFYGDSDKNPDEFNGLAKRYDSYGGSRGDYSYQVISAGGSTETSRHPHGWSASVTARPWASILSTVSPDSNRKTWERTGAPMKTESASAA